MMQTCDSLTSAFSNSSDLCLLKSTVNFHWHEVSGSLLIYRLVCKIPSDNPRPRRHTVSKNHRPVESGADRQEDGDLYRVTWLVRNKLRYPRL